MQRKLCFSDLVLVRVQAQVVRTRKVGLRQRIRGKYRQFEVAVFKQGPAQVAV